MNIWHDINSNRINDNDFVAVIEIPKGSKTKYEVDKESGFLMLDRVLSTSTQYPLNYGFIPKTLSGDGDPLDVLVLCSETINPLTLVRCYPIGIIYMLDNGKTDEKIIALNEKAALRDQIIAGKINEVAMQANNGIAVTNGRIDCLAQTLSQITQVYVPASSVTPRPMPRFNSFVVPPAPIPPAADAASSTSTSTTNG